jgi:isopenicillin N synthase-like dioxygenase
MVSAEGQCSDSSSSMASTAPLVIDLTAYIEKGVAGDLPRSVLDAMRNASCVVVRDPRVPYQQNEEFLDLMEQYFSQPREVKMRDIRADSSYQVH